MTGTPEARLEVFSFLTEDRWVAKYLMQDYEVDTLRGCKVCDEWVPMRESEKHATMHRKEWIKLKAVRAEAAKLNRIRNLHPTTLKAPSTEKGKRTSLAPGKEALTEMSRTMTQKQIAAQIGVSQGAVSTWYKQYGIIVKRGRRPQKSS